MTNMKAVLHTAYGSPDELQIKEVDKPQPAENELLIRIYASSVTTSDCNVRNLTFTPKIFHLPMKVQFGFSKPKHRIIGMDLAGVVESVGAGVTLFKPGDAVFGTTEPLFGAHAEYICLPEDAVVAHKPEKITFEEAATYPVMANTALHFMRDLAQVKPGDKVLIIGASGGVGTFAVQLAVHYGAQVTGVCSTSSVALVKSLGAREVIDYTKQDFTQSDDTYDVIFDVPGKSSFAACKHILAQDGVFLVTIPTLNVMFQMIGNKHIKLGSAPSIRKNLLDLAALIEGGALKTVIGRTYPLEQIADAFRYVERGHKHGNVAISIHPDSGQSNTKEKK